MNKKFKQTSQIIKDCVSFTWEVQDFPEFYPSKKCIESSIFSCFDSQWKLKLYPNWSEYQKASGYLSVELVDVSVQPSTGISIVRIGFEAKDNDYESFYVEKKNDVEKSSVLTSVTPDSGYIAFQITKNAFSSSRKPILRGGNTLTIFCNMEVFTTVHGTLSEVNEESFEHGEVRCFNQGFMSLSKNISNMLGSSRFTDVTLKVGKDTFQAHKVVLASRSKVFEAMFESGMKEGVENVVSVVEMKSATAKEMLQYMYAGKIQELSMGRAKDLYVAADRYDLQELKGWTKDFILRHISAGDVCEVAVLADLHSDEELMKAAKRMFKQNTKAVLSSEMWNDFGKENPVVYKDLMESTLLSDTIVGLSQNTVFRNLDCRKGLAQPDDVAEDSPRKQDYSAEQGWPSMNISNRPSNGRGVSRNRFNGNSNYCEILHQRDDERKASPRKRETAEGGWPSVDTSIRPSNGWGVSRNRFNGNSNYREILHRRDDVRQASPRKADNAEGGWPSVDTSIRPSNGWDMRINELCRSRDPRSNFGRRDKEGEDSSTEGNSAEVDSLSKGISHRPSNG